MPSTTPSAKPSQKVNRTSRPSMLRASAARRTAGALCAHSLVRGDAHPLVCTTRRAAESIGHRAAHGSHRFNGVRYLAKATSPAMHASKLVSGAHDAPPEPACRLAGLDLVEHDYQAMVRRIEAKFRSISRRVGGLVQAFQTLCHSVTEARGR